MNPWLSFDSYKESHSRQFKGRDEDIHNLYQLVSRSDLSVIYAESGIGKSSLIDAGLKPRLRSGLFLPVPVVLSEGSLTGDPLVCFEKLLQKSLKDEVVIQNAKLTDVKYEIKELVFPEDEVAGLAQVQHVFGSSIWWYLKCHYVEVSGMPIIPIFILDQFEEYLRLDESWVKAFFSLASELSVSRIPERFQKKLEQLDLVDQVPDLSHAHPFKLLFSLREEYIGQLDYWGGQVFFIPSLKENRYSLRPLTEEQAAEVITGQQDEHGEAIDTLNPIKDLIISQSQDEDTGKISTLLLSVLCYKYYEKAYTLVSGKKAPLKESDQIDSPGSLIMEFYDDQMRKADVPSKHKKQIEHALVDSSGRRRRIKVEKDKELGKMRFSEKYQKALENRHLIKVTPTRVQGRVVDFIELVHDKVADGIQGRRREKSIQRSHVYSRILVFLGLIGFIALLTHFEMNTRRGDALARYVGDYGNKLYLLGFMSHNPDVRNLIVDTNDFAGGILFITDCDNLESVSLMSAPEKGKLRLRTNPKLGELRFGPHVKSLDLDVSDCPNLSLVLSDSLRSLQISGSSRMIIKPFDHPHPFLHLENDILWDKLSGTIIYAHESAPDIVVFPDSVQVGSTGMVKYNGKSFMDARDSVNWVSRSSYRLHKVNYWPYDSLDFNHPSLEGIEVIDEKAVAGNSSIRKVILSHQVRDVRDSAFAGCSQLKSFVASDSCMINPSFLNGCNSLEFLQLPRILAVSADGVFLDRSHPLKKVKMPVHAISRYYPLQFGTDALRETAIQIDSGMFSLVNGVVCDTARNRIVGYQANSYDISRDDSLFIDNHLYESQNGILGYYDTDTSTVFHAVDVPPKADLGAFLKHEFKRTKDWTRSGSLYRVGNQIYSERGAKYVSERDFICVGYGIKASDVKITWPDIEIVDLMSPSPWKTRSEGRYYTWSSYISILLNSIPNKETKHIIIVVPKGSLSSYQELSRQIGFRGSIQESSRFLGRFLDVSYVHLIDGLGWFLPRTWALIGAALLIVLAFVLYYLYLRKQNKNYSSHQLLLISLMTVMVAVLCWFFVYWPIYDILTRFLRKNVIAQVVSVLLSTVFSFVAVRLLVSRDLNLIEMGHALKKGTVELWRNRKELPGRIRNSLLVGLRNLVYGFKRNWKWWCLGAVILLALFGVVKAVRLLREHQKRRIEQVAEAESLLDSNRPVDAAKLLMDVLPQRRGVHEHDSVEIQASILLQRAMYQAKLLPEYAVKSVSPDGRWILGEERGQPYLLDSRDFSFREWFHAGLPELDWMSTGSRLLGLSKREDDSLFIEDLAKNPSRVYVNKPASHRWAPILARGKDRILWAGRNDSLFVYSLSDRTDSLLLPDSGIGYSPWMSSPRLVSNDSYLALAYRPNSILVYELSHGREVLRVPASEFAISDWGCVWRDEDSLATHSFSSGTQKKHPYGEFALGLSGKDLLALKSEQGISIWSQMDSLFSIPTEKASWMAFADRDRFMVFGDYYGQVQIARLRNRSSFRLPMESGWKSDFSFFGESTFFLFEKQLYVLIPTRKQLDYFRTQYRASMQKMVPDTISVPDRSCMPSAREQTVFQDTLYHRKSYRFEDRGNRLSLVDPDSGRPVQSFEVQPGTVRIDRKLATYQRVDGSSAATYAFPGAPEIDNSWFSQYYSNDYNVLGFRDKVLSFNNYTAANPSCFLIPGKDAGNVEVKESGVFVSVHSSDSVYVLSNPTLKLIVRLPAEQYRRFQVDSLGYQSPYYRIEGENTYLVHETGHGPVVFLSYPGDDNLLARSYDQQFDLRKEPGKRLSLWKRSSGERLEVFSLEKDAWFSDDSRYLVIDGRGYDLMSFRE